MFIRVDTYNRLFPAWKTITYINLSNVLHVEVANKKVNLYTVFRPKYSAYRINFETHEEAQKFAAQTFARLPEKVPHLTVQQPATLERRFRQDEASPDPLAMAAVQEWDRQLK